MVSRRQYKPQTRQVLELRKRHPEWPLARIGEEVGISRQRVHQVLKRDRLPTRSRAIPNDPEPGIVKELPPANMLLKNQGNARRRTKTEPFMADFTRIPLEEARAKEKPTASARVLDEYKKYVVAIGPKEAGRFKVADDREGQMIRTRIKRAAVALGLNVVVRKRRNETLFWKENVTSNSSSQ